MYPDLLAHCPFCPPDPSRLLLANTHAIAIPDGFPVSPGHTLIIPKRHIASFFEATLEEQTAMFDLLTEVRERILNPPCHSRKVTAGPAPRLLFDKFPVGISGPCRYSSNRAARRG